MSFTLTVRIAVAAGLLTAGSMLIGSGAGIRFAAATASERSSEDRTSVRWNPPASELPASPAKRARVSHLEVPRLHQSLYVVEGSDDETLKLGPGHVRGTVLPGEDGNCVIAGHRDTHFRFLKDLRPNDLIFLETADGRFCYRVANSRVVQPTNLQVLQPTTEAQLHLITCFPFRYVGHAPQRYVVTAVLE